MVYFSENKFRGSRGTGLQIYGVPASLLHDFKIWHSTFQGNGSDGRILFSCEKMSLVLAIHLCYQQIFSWT